MWDILPWNRHRATPTGGEAGDAGSVQVVGTTVVQLACN
jgi:hypothetical protein